MKKFNKIIPTEIILEILSRLPTESVLRCKAVCKTWKSLIHHRSFRQMHNPKPSDSGNLRYVFLDVSEDEDEDGVYVQNTCSFFEYNGFNSIGRKIKIQTPLDDYIVMGSANGLICIYGYDQLHPDVKPKVEGPAFIFNPVTKEYAPRFANYVIGRGKGRFGRNVFSHLACGFGYLAETKEYKVVRIYRKNTAEPTCAEASFIQVEVYTLGSGKGWRRVGKFDLGFHFRTQNWEQTHGVFLNGCLHWRNDIEDMVVVFDLADEKFREHIPPPPMLTDIDDFDGSPVIGVSGGGVLYYAFCESLKEEEEEKRKVSDVWLLTKKNDQNEQEEHQSWGWSKVDSLDQKEPFAFTNNGTVLRYNQGTLSVFNSATATWGTILDTSVICRQVFPHEHTLVSLKELGEENVKIMGKD